MAKYKILKTGYFSEDWLNEVGKIVDLRPETAGPAVERGYLEEIKEKVVKKRRRAKKK